MDKYIKRKERLEKALYSWLDAVEDVETIVNNLIENYNVSNTDIMKKIDIMKSKFTTLQNNIKTYK